MPSAGAKKIREMVLNDRRRIGDGEYLLNRKRYVRSRKRQRRWNSAPTTCSARLVSAVRCISKVLIAPSLTR